eukprot:scaffold34245_cov58-Phaeocystis_antarctica.AAC.1
MGGKFRGLGVRCCSADRRMPVWGLDLRVGQAGGRCAQWLSRAAHIPGTPPPGSEAQRTRAKPLAMRRLAGRVLMRDLAVRMGEVLTESAPDPEMLQRAVEERRKEARQAAAG